MNDIQRLNEDAFEVSLKHEVTEGVIDPGTGKAVLCRLSGAVFFCDAFSRNKRYYKRELWEKVLANPFNQTRMKEGDVLGACGHKLKLDEEAIQEGNISHVIRSLQIMPNGDGHAEIDVLDTKAGRNIATLAKANCKLYMSSRADGKYNGRYQGSLIVDPESYVWETFDFVRRPGFLKASPKLQENLATDVKIDQSHNVEKNQEKNHSDKVKSSSIAEGVSDKNKQVSREKNSMEETQLIESLTKQNGALNSDLDSAVALNESLQDSNKSLSAQNESLQKQVEELKEVKEKLKLFEDLADYETIKAALDVGKKNQDLLENFEKENGSLAKIAEKLDEVEELSEAVSLLGGWDSICNKLDELSEFHKISSTPEKLEESLSNMTKKLRESAAQSVKAKAETIAEEYGVEPRKAFKMLQKIGEEETRSILESLKVKSTKKDDSDKYRSKKVNEDTDKKPAPSSTSNFHKSALQKLNEASTRVARTSATISEDWNDPKNRHS